MSILEIIKETFYIVASTASILALFFVFKFNDKAKLWLKNLLSNIKDKANFLFYKIIFYIVLSSIIIGFFIVAGKFGTVEIEVAKAEKLLTETNNIDNVNNFIALKNQQKTWSIIFILYGTAIIAFFIWLNVTIKKFIPEFYISDTKFADRTYEEQKKIIRKEIKDIKYKVESTKKAYRKYHDINQLLMSNISYIELLLNFSDKEQIEEIDDKTLKLYKSIRESVKSDHQLYYESIKAKDKVNEIFKKHSSNSTKK